MPYRSSRQRAWMHIHEPAVARRWDRKYGGRVVKKAVKQYRRKR
jgi:hypothetical protein